uniref:PPM-type phosphatase domain-containing protein n=1 Tax=Chromera velia CCMP2878 TaxID=1169474 RepID=A0A0G4F1J9_9ALVE|eukprot:Cvel_14732.t1-p1 / transcript=Cvel_14732.t1 / gene=Cvel_14732 / organism=Chromera_velia_CCMP2878 / gene_product=Probable protein phosphatase 2C 72, putative / transcript_product=Probable protein phosphatase 2C 72, putative / location=Cvel_scaffold1059:50697-55948(+) / protein_length=335 / sequence_SO=supercontig / SO=protein_coding / is_pseudo=false
MECIYGIMDKKGTEDPGTQKKTGTTSDLLLTDCTAAWSSVRGSKGAKKNPVKENQDDFFILNAASWHRTSVGPDLGVWQQHVCRLLTQAFEEAQADLCEQRGLKVETSGATATVVLHWKGLQRIAVAHIGDSRAALGLGVCKPSRWNTELSPDTRPVFQELTEDHFPDTPKELQRLRVCRAKISPDGTRLLKKEEDEEDDEDQQTQMHSQPQLHPQLVRTTSFSSGVWASPRQNGVALSRSFGDTAFVSSGLSHVPDVAFHPAPPGSVLLLASDGVWQFMDLEASLQSIRVGLQGGVLQDATNRLAAEAWTRWIRDPVMAPRKYIDDITLVTAIL